MPDTSSTVPPFIPGLLIVSLLIIISLLIGWRNYARRGNPRLMPGMGNWTFWEVDGQDRGTNKPEKPKLWEVGVVPRVDVDEVRNEAGWREIMPLSATHLNPEPPPAEIPKDHENPTNRTNSHPSSHLSRLNFFSPSATISPSSPVSPPIPPHRLQVSVLISMPSPPNRTRLRSPPESSPPESSLKFGNETPPRVSTSSSLRADKAMDCDAEEEMEGEEGAPDVAFGVAVLPWQKDEDEETGSTNISVT